MTRGIVPACPADLAKNFVGGIATAKTFGPGEPLYKLVSMPIVRERILRSPWFIPQSEFDRLRRTSLAERRPLANVIRERLSIASRWNPGMDGLFILYLTRPKLGWIGRAAAQPAFNELLIGWGEQACIPDLDWRDIAVTKMQVPFYQSGQL